MRCCQFAGHCWKRVSCFLLSGGPFFFTRTLLLFPVRGLWEFLHILIIFFFNSIFKKFYFYLFIYSFPTGSRNCRSCQKEETLSFQTQTTELKVGTGMTMPSWQKPSSFLFGIRFSHMISFSIHIVVTWQQKVNVHNIEYVGRVDYQVTWRSEMRNSEPD